MEFIIRQDGTVNYLGYVPNPEATDRFCNNLAKYGHEPDGSVIAAKLGDEKKDMVLYPFLMKAFPDWKAGVQALGDCVSFGSAHNTDVLMGVQAYFLNFPEDIFFQTCSEAAYGFMRCEIFGRNNNGGDGANGGDAAESVMKFGTLHRTKYLNGKYDFTTYSGSKAKTYGRTGVPDDLEPLAKEHIVKTATKVTNFDDAAKFIMNGYPILNAHGSNPTFTGTRDKDGYGRGSGASHCMNYIGVRWGAKPALLKTNTGWNSSPVDGPMWPDNFPTALGRVAWWESAELCDYVLKGNDSFAYSDYKGFPKKNLPDYGTLTYL
jgi:hypothetical protein